MTQRYTDEKARRRMREGRCPECGAERDVHVDRGAIGCSLTDRGVAERIEAFGQEKRS